MMIKIIYTTALALAVAIASTGCKHRPYAVTPIPPAPNPNVADLNGGGTIAPGPAFNPGPGGPAPIAENPDDLSNYTQDRSALAADTIHFAFDSAVVRDSERANLQQVASALQGDPNTKVMIEGNCDERGTEEYNRSLGERRAEAAREALVGMGVDANRIHTISYGKDKPADPGHDEAAWKQNRRDDFVLLHPKTGA
ncbi:MAG TPA: peptidoglycan-associated lipoprotein Pal [Verrucomicrobiae bacterium]|nr:peptidoglycan-associated lipoprotein Pal [Verrucomicrobiae bacterium]